MKNFETIKGYKKQGKTTYKNNITRSIEDDIIQE